jgi:hypothetical protein
MTLPPGRVLGVLVGTALVVLLVPLTALAASGAASRTFSPATAAATTSASTSPGRAVVRTRSWNPHVSCRAVVTTLATVLGNQRNRHGGATYRGGGFRPGIPDRRAFHPPCRRSGTPTFVQLNRVKLGTCRQINDDGDWTCELTDPTVPRRRPLVMSQIHVETDQKFRAAGGWRRPPGGVLVDIQGFVFWDPGHTSASWHHYSGWEIHSLTAWRRSPRR